jgi:hypothetical protein
MRCLRALVVLVLPVLAACGGALMSPAPSAVPAPPDTATVVFLRTGFTGSAISAAVYDGERFAGIIMRHDRITLHVPPGTRRFMVVGEAADFLDADLAAGKEYFVLVAPRMGLWRARFSLRPIAPGGGYWDDLPGWLKKSTPIVPNAKGEAWARENAADVREKEQAYLVKWLARTKRPALRPEDGVDPGSVR